MIDKPIDVTPDALRHEAKMLRYTGRGHAATIMEWTADRIAALQARLDAVNALEVLTNGEAEVFALIHGFDPGFVRADHLRKALGGDDETQG